MTQIIVSPFVTRQTLASPFSCYTGEGGWDALLARVVGAFAAGAVRPGYRDGVVLVDIDVADIKRLSVLMVTLNRSFASFASGWWANESATPV